MSTFTELATPAKPGRLLVVEDDLVSQTFLRMSLQRHGHQITIVGSAEAAQQELMRAGCEGFDCVVTDYHLGGQNGLDLIDWIKTQDVALSSIILTAEQDKSVITEALRRGVSDFLEKPVNLQRLAESIAQAVEHTDQQRQMARSNLAIKDLGRAQLWLAQNISSGDGRVSVDVVFYPKLEAGGDFFGHFEIDRDQYCCLLTDVSGHDLRAAYVSTYFHGIFRGMTQRAAPLPEIFSFFNDFLVREWNQAGQFTPKNSGGTSLAATAVLMDQRSQTVSVVICGAPLPVLVLPDGRAELLGDRGGPPLGWFSGLDATTISRPTHAGGTICLWTDGLDDLADSYRVQPICVAFALRRAKKRSAATPFWLRRAVDDILFAAIHLPGAEARTCPVQPLLIESYRGDQSPDIDTFVANWQRHLKFAFPDINETIEHDILLAAREAVLNALKHGCRQQPGKTARFQIAYHSIRDAVRIYIDDPGNGHNFDFAAHDQSTSTELIDEHRGLIFIMNLAQSLKSDRNGASLTLDFNL
jgi:CheY-like chemotaxis protein/anti-sigma regulatory factor (Ser/Thr protein kinase)